MLQALCGITTTRRYLLPVAGASFPAYSTNIKIMLFSIAKAIALVEMKSPAQPDPWIGRSIGDRLRYRLEKRLGAGGMGDVFVAMDTLLGQQVALKLLKDKLIASPSLRKRFEHEVAICAALKSDHIVKVSDCGVTTEGHPFYVMEYLRGESLGQLLQKQQRLSVERTVNIIAVAKKIPHHSPLYYQAQALIKEWSEI